jgi:GT2 family glycosyltransferase
VTAGVSVVIPVRNGLPHLAAQLDAVASQTWAGPLEVVVVDDGSTDGSFELAAATAGVRVLRSAGRAANGARNTGIAAARHDVIVLLDADDLVDRGAVDAHVRALGDADVVVGATNYFGLPAYDDEPRFDPAPRPPTSPFGGPPAGAFCNASFRRSVWEAIGGLDERISGVDDIEFCWRAQAAGFRLEYAPDAVVAYRQRSSWRSIWRQQHGWATAHPLLFRQYRWLPLERPSMRSVVRRWGWCVRHAPAALLSGDAARRREFVRLGAMSTGRIVGSVRHRTLYL